MADEKTIIKRFLDTLDTENLCSITRSIYHGGGIQINSREEAEALLLTQEGWRIISCKKTSLKSILLFLFKHGINVPPDVTKIQAIEYFKMLYNPNALQVASPVQPGNFKNMVEKPPPTQDLENFIKMFTKHFYSLYNEKALDNRYFFENASMAVIIASNTEEIKEQYHDTTSVIQGLFNIKQQHSIFFAPNVEQVKYKKESHGLIKVQIGGTLHQGVGRMVGVFDQAFVLREDPLSQNTWKILSIHFLLKSTNSCNAQIEPNDIKCITY